MRAIETRAPNHPARDRFTRVARLVTGQSTATAADGVLWLADLVQEFRIPRLRHYGVGSEHVASLVEKAARASSMKGNPLELTTAELTELLAARCVGDRALFHRNGLKGDRADPRTWLCSVPLRPETVEKGSVP